MDRETRSIEYEILDPFDELILISIRHFHVVIIMIGLQ